MGLTRKIRRKLTRFRFQTVRALTLTLQSLLFWRKNQDPHPKNKAFALCRTLEILGKECKNAQQRKTAKRKKRGKRKKQGLEGQGETVLRQWLRFWGFFQRISTISPHRFCWFADFCFSGETSTNRGDGSNFSLESAFSKRALHSKVPSNLVPSAFF